MQNTHTEYTHAHTYARTRTQNEDPKNTYARHNLCRNRTLGRVRTLQRSSRILQRLALSPSPPCISQSLFVSLKACTKFRVTKKLNQESCRSLHRMRRLPGSKDIRTTSVTVRSHTEHRSKTSSGSLVKLTTT